MEKIKSVLSHGHGKEGDAAQDRHDTPTAAEFDRSTTGDLTGEGSHLAGAQQSSPGVSGEYHPIYDRFAKGGTSGEPTQTTDHASHFSNTPNVPQTSNVGGSSAPSATSSLLPNQYRPAPHGDVSTASIKSGVIGFPQGSDETHAALPNNNPFEQSHRGSDQVAPGEGLVGATTGDQRSSLDAPGRTPQINLQRQESDVPESGRSFPLSGGVTQQAPKTTTSNEREPGSKEGEAGVHEGQGREGLAGAAAAAAASSVVPQNDGRTEANLQPQTSRSPNPDALAAATTATSAAYGWNNHDHGGHGHKYEGERLRSPEEPKKGLLFTSGPHVTDIANSLDPHLHIPGEFPSPTPVEESNAPSYLQSKSSTETDPTAFAEPELRHTGSLDEPLSRSAEPTSQHHSGRDAAIASGLGAAGAGAYAAGKHQKEPADIRQETFPPEPNPYSSKQLDPRVDTVPRGGYTEQRFDPTVSENRGSRNAALTGGAIGSSHPSTQEAPKGSELENKVYPAAGQDIKSDSQHHYSRDAALVGAGAATTAGLYASQRENEPDSGPASSTIGPHKSNVANVLDPRVQPNPDLQKHHYAAPTAEDPAPSTVGPHKSDIANVLDPRVLPDPQKQKAAPKESHSSQLESNVIEKDPHREQHHYGRDAAVAGGAGAAGYGAYEAAKSYGEHPSTQPSASMNDQRYDASAPGAHHSNVAGMDTQHHATSQDQQHHYGRDAAVVGGLGAAGAGAYAATREQGGDHQYSALSGHGLDEQRYDPNASNQQAGAPQSQHHYGRDAALVGGAGALGGGAYAATRGHDQAKQPSATHEYQQPSATQTYGQPETATHQRSDSALVPEEDHTKHNAALGTAAGAGALGAGAYGLSQYDAQKEQESRLKEQQKAFDDQQKAFEKQQAHDQKHHDKLAAAEEKKHQKEAEHKEREHAKELEKQQKEHEERLAAARAEQERRSQEPEEEGTPEKKHRFLTFLNKKDKDRASNGENSPRQSHDNPPHSKEYAAGAGAAGTAAYEHEHEDGRHIGEKHGRSVLHKDPPKGHPAREALEHPGSVGKREHVGTDGPIGDPNLVSGDRQTVAGVYGAHPAEDVTSGHHTVKEPHTGLPMNVEKYGDGHGGTDGSNTIPGQHQFLGESTTDWEAVRKGNTLY